MAVKLYVITAGMHQHPQTFAERGYKPSRIPFSYGPKDHQLLYPGDRVKVEEAFVMRPPTMGGWADPQKDGTWKITCAYECPDQEADEEFVMRDEPSRIAGINIREAALKRLEREEEEDSSVTMPVPPVAREAVGLSSVKRVRV